MMKALLAADDMFAPCATASPARDTLDMLMSQAIGVWTLAELDRLSGVGEYWVVDGARRSILVVSANAEDREVVQALSWHPQGATEPLTLDVSRYFALALDVER